MIRYKISDDNLHIIDSYKVPKKNFVRELSSAKNLHPSSGVWNRSFNSLKKEWGVHNALYAIGIFRSRTKDADLNYPQKWYVKLAYALAGNIVWPFIR